MLIMPETRAIGYSRSARLPSLFYLFLLMPLMLPALAVKAAPPPWWTTRGVLLTNTSKDFAPANQGQLKNIANAAYLEMNTQFWNCGGSGASVSNMVEAFSTTNGYYTINQGQLKNTAQPFYDRLIALDFPCQYPWSTTTTDDTSFAIANLGQLKNVFGFSFDPDGDGLTYAQENDLGTNPFDSDSDDDSLSDGYEIFYWRYVVSTQTYSWVDITTSGTCIMSNETATCVSVPLGFTFDFATNSFTNVSVNVNGTLNFNEDFSSSSNDCLPVDDATNMLAVFWEPLLIVEWNQDGVWYKLDSTQNYDRIVVTWNASVPIDKPPFFTNVIFQSEIRSDGDIIYRYCKMTNTSLGTDVATVGLQYNPFYECLNHSTNYIHNDLELLFSPYQLSPTNSDTDADNMPDGWEISAGLHPLNPSDASGDTDEDGLSNANEYQYGTNPNNIDSDGDNLTDGIEVYTWQSCPTNTDTDADGLNDGDEVNAHNTIPTDSDTDDDTMPDGWEVSYGLDPTDNSDANEDSDSDGLINSGEYSTGASPIDPDTDGDNLPDGTDYQPVVYDTSIPIFTLSFPTNGASLP